MPELTDFPYVADWEYDGRTLFVSGDRSDYISRDHDRQIFALFPQAEFAVIKVPATASASISRTRSLEKGHRLPRKRSGVSERVHASVPVRVCSTKRSVASSMARPLRPAGAWT